MARSCSTRSSARRRASTWMPSRGNALIEDKAIGQGESDVDCVGEIRRPHSLSRARHQVVLRRPADAGMRAIDLQDFGFTDIKIGRKHAADSSLRRQGRKRGRLRRKLRRSGTRENRRRRSEGRIPVSFSFKELKAMIGRGELPAPGNMKAETAKVMIETYWATNG